MTLTSQIPDGQGLAFTAIGQPCFYCWEACTDPAVYWVGSTGDVYLHPACLMEWMICLFRDVHEIKNPDHYERRRRA